MIHKKIVGIVAAILATTVTIITTTTFATGDEVDDMVAKYNKTTQRFNRTEVSTIISEVEEMDNGGNSGGGSGGNGGSSGGGNSGGGSGGGGGTNPPPTPTPPGPTPPRSPVNQTFYDFDCAMGTYKDYGNGFTGTSQGHACWDSLKGFGGTSTFKGGGCGFASASIACSKVSGKAWTAGDIITTLGGDLTIDSATNTYKWNGAALKDWNFSQSQLETCLKAANPSAKLECFDNKKEELKNLPNTSDHFFYFVHATSDAAHLFSSGGQHWFIIGHGGYIIYKSSKASVTTFDPNNVIHLNTLNRVWKVSW